MERKTSNDESTLTTTGMLFPDTKTLIKHLGRRYSNVEVERASPVRHPRHDVRVKCHAPDVSSDWCNANIPKHLDLKTT